MYTMPTTNVCMDRKISRLSGAEASIALQKQERVTEETS